jgi:hypothetical protein
MPSSEPTGRVPIGRYVLEVGAPAGTLITPHAEAGDYAPLAKALESEQRERPTPGAAAEHAVEAATEATARAEEAVDLFRATVEGSLLDPTQLAGRIDLMLELLQRLDREGRWEEAIRVARAINGLLALAMRWADLVRSLRVALQAAERLGNSSGIAWAQHELGTLHLAADDPAGAEKRLSEAQAIRRRIVDRDGLATTERNLSVLCQHLRELLREGRLELRRGQARRTLLAVTAATLLLLLGAVAGAVVDPRGEDESAVGVGARLSVDVKGDGQVTSRPEGISCPDRCEHDFARRSRIVLIAEPSDDATFAGWRGACQGTGPCRPRLPRDRTVIATFRQESPPGKATLRVDPPPNGRVTSSPEGIDCVAQCETRFPLRERVTLTAEPDEGYGLNGWLGDCQTSPCTLTMDGDRRVSVDFRPQRTIAVTVEIDEGATGTVTSNPPRIKCSGGKCSAEFLANRDAVQLSATGDFATFRWDGDCKGQPPPTCSLRLDANHEATARFGTIE